MTKEFVINQEICTGCELCVDMCPNVFRMANGAAEVYNPTGETEKKIQETIDICPVEAISWKS